MRREMPFLLLGHGTKITAHAQVTRSGIVAQCAYQHNTPLASRQVVGGERKVHNLIHSYLHTYGAAERLPLLLLGCAGLSPGQFTLPAMGEGTVLQGLARAKRIAGKILRAQISPDLAVAAHLEVIWQMRSF